VALDAAGAVVPGRTLKVEQDEENRALTVERWGSAGGDTQPRLAVLVQVPETSSTDTGFWLSGNVPELGAGKPDGVKLYKAMNSRYAAVLSIAPETWLAFKVTRGAVDTEEVNPGGEDLASHIHVMGSGLERLELSVSRWADDPSELTFWLTVPPESPVGTQVALRGSHAVFGGGVADKALTLEPQGDNAYSATVTVRGREELTFNVWMTAPSSQVERDASGALRTRTFKVRGDTTLSVNVEHWGQEDSGTGAQPQVVFLVSVPSNTPADANLYLSGNTAALGGGKPDGLKLSKTVDGHYAATISAAPGTSFEYAVTRGTAGTVEVNVRGEELAPRTFTMGARSERVSVAVERWRDAPLELNFQVTVPPETPADAKVVIKGSNERLGGTGLELTYQSGTTFSAKIVPTRGEEFTYGAWMTASGATQAALDAVGAVQPARTFQVKGDATLNLAVDRWGPETGGSTEPQFVLVVAVPSNTPAGSTIYVVGNQSQVGGWDPGAVPLYKALNGRHAITLSFAPGTSLEYKLTRGSWDKVEKGPEGEEIDNRTHTTGSGFERTFVTVAKWADLDGVPATPVLTGNIEYVREVTPTDTTLKKRDVIVWLPPDYKTNPTRRYPVLYMHDGQNLMDATTGFAGEWGVDETAQQLVESGQVEPVIIVGVYNTADRIPEYTQVPTEKYGGGNADAYGKFLVEELKPLIDGKYRTKPEAQYTGLAGSSLGGLVSMYLGMKHSGTFNRLGVISPSVWWADRDIVTRVNALESKPPLRIWLDIGTAEGSSAAEETETVDDTRLLRDALTGKGWALGEDLKYTEVEGGKHNEKAWAARFGDILKYLYPATP
jgi:predicted alpha/beta superfamily hydrolase